MACVECGESHRIRGSHTGQASDRPRPAEGPGTREAEVTLTYVDCCPCHGAAEDGVRPPPESRRYVVPQVQVDRDAALARRVEVSEARWALLREGTGEDAASQAVARLNEAYPLDRWVAAESWRSNLDDCASFIGAIFPSVRFQYRKDLWVLGQELRRYDGNSRRGSSMEPLVYQEGPDWLRGGRATVMGPRTDVCAYWEALQLMRNLHSPSQVELAEAHSYFEHNVKESDWQRPYTKQALELYTGCVTYLSNQGVGQEEARQRARQFVTESIDAWCYGGVDWPEGIEVSSLWEEYDNATRYLGGQDGTIDYDLPVVKSVLAYIDLP